MRILFVTPYVPSLIRVRPLNFIKQLAKRHQVTLVTLVTGDPYEDEAINHLRHYCEQIHPIHLRKAASLANCCRRLMSPMPLQAAYTEFSFAREFIEDLTRRNRYDVIHVEHIRGAGLVSGITSIPKIYDSVDCITRLLKQRLSKELSLFKRALSIEELIKMRSYESAMAASFDKVVITSEADRRALVYLMRRYANQPDMPFGPGSILRRSEDTDVGYNGLDKVSVVRNGVDSDYFQPIRLPSTDRQEIVFSGKMGYFPNVSAVLDFYHKVLPRIRREKPKVRFRVVGSDPPDTVRKLQEDPIVEVTGYVPDIRPHLASADVVVCPLSIGVGIQNKVLEAMSMGKPVVATPIACRGIPNAIHGEHLIRAEDEMGMATSVIGLLERPEQRVRLGENARRLVSTTYSWRASTLELEGTYESTLEPSIGSMGYAA